MSDAYDGLRCYICGKDAKAFRAVVEQLLDDLDKDKRQKPSSRSGRIEVTRQETLDKVNQEILSLKFLESERIGGENIHPINVTICGICKALIQNVAGQPIQK